MNKNLKIEAFKGIIFNKNKGYSHADSIELIQAGEEYFRTYIKLIHQAKETIHIQIYKFELDETGQKVISALINATKRGVAVFMVTDAFGSENLSDFELGFIKEQGINIRKFGQVFYKTKFRFGRRMHTKLLLIDKHCSLIGGINVANKYKGDPTTPPWLDFAVIIKGKVNERLFDKTLLFWKTGLHKYLKKPNLLLTEQVSPTPENQIVKFAVNDRYSGKFQISRSYSQQIRQAKQEILIMASYFLPGQKLKRRIIKSAKKGVTVKIILSKNSDLPMVDKATRHLYPELLEAGVELFEYSSSVVHGKAAIIDNKWSTIGSYNLNPLSEFGSIELNANIYSSKFCDDFRIKLLDVMSSCTKVHIEEFKKQSGIWNKTMRFISYLTLRFLFRIFVSFTKN